MHRGQMPATTEPAVRPPTTAAGNPTPPDSASPKLGHDQGVRKTREAQAICTDTAPEPGVLDRSGRPPGCSRTPDRSRIECVAWTDVCAQYAVPISGSAADGSF